MPFRDSQLGQPCQPCQPCHSRFAGLIGILVSIGMALVGGVRPVWSQSPPPTTPANVAELPSTSAPGLLLLILLDDSSTMYGEKGQTRQGQTSAEYANRLSPATFSGTDPKKRRWDVVERILDTLAADQRLTHRAAVYSFAKDGGNQWLTRNSSDSDHFLALGKDINANSQASPKQRAALPFLEKLQPGNTGAALKAALEEFVAQNKANVTLKPVVLLITDDVPIVNIEDSPWGIDRARWLKDTQDLFEPQIARLRNDTRYTPTSQFCKHGTKADGAVLATFAMGAANWIPAAYKEPFTIPSNGVIPEDKDTFFEGLARANGWLRLDDPAKPLVWRIDPSLQGRDARVKDDLRQATDDFLSEIRCIKGKELTGINAPENKAAFTFTQSALSPQFRVIVETTIGNADPYPVFNLFATTNDGRQIEVAPADSKVCTVQKAAPRNTYKWMVVNCERELVLAAGNQWDTNWTLTLNTTPPARVYYESEFDASLLNWQTPVEDKTLDETHPANTELQFDLQLCLMGTLEPKESKPESKNRCRLPLQNTDIAIDKFKIRLYTAGASTEIVQLEAKGSEANKQKWVVTLPRAQTDKVAYDLRAAVTFKPEVIPKQGHPINTTTDYPLQNEKSVRFAIEPVFRILEPQAGSKWDCLNGKQRVRFALTTGSTENAISGLGAVVQIEIRAKTNATATLTPTLATSDSSTIETKTTPTFIALPTHPPLAIIRRVAQQSANEAIFTGEVDCARLPLNQANASPSLEIVAILPGKVLPQDLSYQFTPSPTPIPSATPISPSPTRFIPTPTPLAYMEALPSALVSPPLLWGWLLLGAGVLYAFVMATPRLFVAWQRHTPLSQVKIIARSPAADSLSVFKRWRDVGERLPRRLPLARFQSQTINDPRDGAAVFTISGDPDGYLIIRNLRRDKQLRIESGKTSFMVGAATNTDDSRYRLQEWRCAITVLNVGMAEDSNAPIFDVLNFRLG